MDNLKSKVVQFYKFKEFTNHENRRHQLDILKELRKQLGEFEVYSEHRNYNHSIELILHFNEVGEYIRIDSHSNDTLNSLLKSNDILYRAIVNISDIGPYIVVFWNLVNLVDDKVNADFLKDENVPSFLKNNLDKMLTASAKSKNLKIFTEPDKSEKCDWLKEIEDFRKVDYIPRLEELLVGGLDIYNEFGL